ncbi:MAG: ribonuclease III [Tissierellia bacterium]|nr:ribonuclease III [Tissierellia bacterium]
MILTEERRKELHELEQSIGYTFEDLNILNLALTHSSYANEEVGRFRKCNERLEFLGDAVMELIVSDYLFYTKVNLREGSMTKFRSQLVCEQSFAYVAKQIHLGKYLLMGKGEEQSGGRERHSVLADSFEALCGAIYIDSDFDTVKEIVRTKLKKFFVDQGRQARTFVDYKTKLQEHCQKKSGARLNYKLIKETGPDHKKIFYMEVSRQGRILGKGHGHNKKAAEQDAAKDALIRLRRYHD